MKNITKKLCMALSVAACLCVGVAANADFAKGDVKASAAEGYTSATFKMLDKGSIRKDSESHGIRFATFIGDSSEQASASYWENHEMGTLFIPKAALGTDELTIDGVYNGASPAVAKFDGNVDNLATNANYEGGKLFNAVLNLSEINVDAALYLNNKIVARTYVQEKGNTDPSKVTYLDAVERAPAYVAVMAMEANEAHSTLSTYVSEIEVSGVEDGYNVAANGEITFNATTNVEGVEVTYTADAGTVTDNKYTALAEEGVSTVEVKIAGGKVSKKTISVSVLGNKHTFYNSYYTPEDSFSYTAYNVSEVKMNGGALAKKYWSQDGDTVTVKKAAITATAQKDNTLTFVSAGGDVTVDAKAYVAEMTSFNEGQLGVEVLGDLNGNAASITADTTAGTVNFKAASTEKRLFVNFNEDYLKAMFAYPTLNTLSVSVEFENITTGTVLGYPSIRTSDNQMQSQYTSYTAKKSAPISRAAFNGLKELDQLHLCGVWIDPNNLQEGAGVKVHSAYVIAVDNADTGNRLYADAALIQQRGLAYSYPGLAQSTIAVAKLGGTTYTTSATKKGDYAVLDASVVNTKIHNPSGYDIQPTGWDRDRVYTYTNATLKDEQYISVDKIGETYTYPFATLENLGAGDKIYRVSLNGQQITTYDENGNITVNKADLEYGHNALEVNVEHTVESSGIYVTTCHTYYRSLCAVTQTDWDSALTFENGMSPFITFIGNVKAEVVDSATAMTELETSYAYATKAPYASGTINNNKVLKISGGTATSASTTMYVYSKYYVARRAALVANGNTGGASRIAAFGAGYMTWTAATLDGTVTDAGDTSGTQPVAKLEKAEECRTVFRSNDTIYNAIYNAETQTINEGQEYFKIIFAAGQKTGYFDDIFSGSGGIYHAVNQVKLDLLGTYDYWNN